MNLYYNGFIGILATSSSLLASIERQQNFHLTFPYIFYTAQIMLCSMLIYSVFYTLCNCNRTFSYTKDRLIHSVIIYSIIYLIAYTNFGFSNTFIFTVGITKTYMIVKSKTNLLNDF